MIIKNLELTSFRNISNEIISPCENVNLIYGENAQGKTNLLESIWLFTGCRSFRGSKDNDLINLNSNKAKAHMDFFSQGRDQSITLEIGESRKFSLNGINLKSPSKVIGNFTAVVFSPVHLSLVKDGPAERRKFLDIAISQLKPKYALTLSKYNKSVKERNTLLKDVVNHSQLYDTLDIWEERIAFFASEIIIQRQSYVNKLKIFCEEIYGGLSCGREKFDIEYQSKGSQDLTQKNDIYENLIFLQKENRKTDMLLGYTSIGPHRDDLLINIDNLPARSFGSQGQQRSASLVLKLGEAAFIKDFSDEQPVALLDDVMSELDGGRQNYILNHIMDWQVFITCCDPSSVKNMKYGKAFEMENGFIVNR